MRPFGKRKMVLVATIGSLRGHDDHFFCVSAAERLDPAATENGVANLMRTP